MYNVYIIYIDVGKDVWYSITKSNRTAVYYKCLHGAPSYIKKFLVNFSKSVLLVFYFVSVANAKHSIILVITNL